MTSKSGTNLFHGAASYTIRHHDLTKADAFGNDSAGRNQQFGGTLGGPILKDRLFFFTAPFFQVATKPVNVEYQNLSAAQRGTPAGQALIAVAPEETVDTKANSQSILSRLDYNFSGGSSFFLRADFTHTAGTTLTGTDNNGSGPSLTSTTPSALSNHTITEIFSGTLVGQLTTPVSSSMLNELRLQFGREDRPRTPQGSGPQVTVQNAGNTIAVYGPQATGVSFGNGAFPSVDGRHQIIDNFSIVQGAHTAKFGVDFLYIGTNLTYSPGQNGHYTFNSVDSFLRREPFSYQQFIGTGALRTSVKELGLYLQDEWRILPTVTLSPGLRYDAEIRPDYLTPTAIGSKAPGATKISDEWNQFQPRLGIAWDVLGRGKTIVRGGGGLYYATTQMPEFAQALLFNGGNPELGLGYAISNVNPAALTNAFAAAGVNLAAAPLNNLPVLSPSQYLTSIGVVGQSVYYMDEKFQNPRALQWKASIEQRMAEGITLSADYTYVNSVNVARKLDRNLGLPTADPTGRMLYPTTRPDTRYQLIVASEAAGRGVYNAFVGSLNVQRRQFILTTNYTLGYNKSLADNERPVGSISRETQFDLNNDYGWSQMDIRHNFTNTAIVYMPFGFTFTNSTRLTSGRTFDARSGTDLNRDGQNTDRPILNGRVIPRNDYRNRAYYGVDMRVERNFVLPNEKGRFIVSADFFNMFNAANIRLSGAGTSYGNAGTVLQNGQLVQLGPQSPATFMQVKDSAGNYIRSNSPGDPFQMQVGVRFQF